MIASTFNLNGMEGVVRVVQHALKGTLALEGAGAILLSLCFIPRMGLLQGIWAGIFHAVSSFCNAGFDLMGGLYGENTSLIGWNSQPVVLLVTGFLIMVGGLGFFVWEDLWKKRSWRGLSVYSKLVLGVTGLLILSGTVFFLWAEYSNPLTLGDMPFWQQALNALFQSITLRTAGFDSLGQGSLREISVVVSILFMLIGGSSGSTAGGLKTGTLAILLLALRAGMRGSEQVTIRERAIPFRRVLDAMTLTVTAMTLFLCGSILITVVEGLPFLSVAFEVASALGTVGLTTGITPGLSPLSHLVLIILMYLGRVGILSFSLAFLTRGRSAAKLKYPEIQVMIG